MSSAARINHKSCRISPVSTQIFSGLGTSSPRPTGRSPAWSWGPRSRVSCSSLCKTLCSSTCCPEYKTFIKLDVNLEYACCMSPAGFYFSLKKLNLAKYPQRTKGEVKHLRLLLGVAMLIVNNNNNGK